MTDVVKLKGFESAPNENNAYLRGIREAEVAMINKLQSGTYGGFAASLGKAYELADLKNRKKLKAAFADIFGLAHDTALLELIGA